jgi:hypothetical protein
METMIETLSVTQILAVSLGLYMVAAAIGLLTERNSYATMIDELRENTALGFLTGAFVLALARRGNGCGSQSVDRPARNRGFDTCVVDAR